MTREEELVNDILAAVIKTLPQGEVPKESMIDRHIGYMKEYMTCLENVDYSKVKDRVCNWYFVKRGV